MKVLQNDQQIIDVSFDSKEGKKAFWHTSAHVLAQAIKRLYPDAKCAIGPAIENGFYYDFDFDFSFNEENLRDVEAEMMRIVKESLSLSALDKSKPEAIAYMEEQ